MSDIYSFKGMTERFEMIKSHFPAVKSDEGLLAVSALVQEFESMYVKIWFFGSRNEELYRDYLLMLKTDLRDTSEKVKKSLTSAK